jgi:hypothetical protein
VIPKYKQESVLMEDEVEVQKYKSSHPNYSDQSSCPRSQHNSITFDLCIQISGDHFGRRDPKEKEF